MARQKGSQNHATIVREFLHKKFKDIAENDLDSIMDSVIKKAVEDESLMAQKLILDNLDKIVQWEQKNEEVAATLEVLINRGGNVESLSGRLIEGRVLGSDTKDQVSRNGLKKMYKDYVGPLQVKNKLDSLIHKEPKSLYKYGDEIMSLYEICKIEGVQYERVYQVMNTYDLTVEEAVEDIKETTVHPDNEKYQ